MPAHFAAGPPPRAPSADPLTWGRLPEAHQMALADSALRAAVVVVAGQADTLADAMSAGLLGDRGGVDALRLLARLMRATGQETMLPAGHA